MGISVGGERGGRGTWSEFCGSTFFAHPSHKILIYCSFPLLEEEVGIVVTHQGECLHLSKLEFKILVHKGHIRTKQVAA